MKPATVAGFVLAYVCLGVASRSGKADAKLFPGLKHKAAQAHTRHSKRAHETMPKKPAVVPAAAVVNVLNEETVADAGQPEADLDENGFPVLPSVAATLSIANVEMKGLTSGASMLDASLARQHQATEAKVAQQKHTYEKHLRKQETKNKAVISENTKIVVDIARLEGENFALTNSTAQIREANAVMHSQLLTLQDRLGIVARFAESAYRITDQTKADESSMLQLLYGNKQKRVQSRWKQSRKSAEKEPNERDDAQEESEDEGEDDEDDEIFTDFALHQQAAVARQQQRLDEAMQTLGNCTPDELTAIGIATDRSASCEFTVFEGAGFCNCSCDANANFDCAPHTNNVTGPYFAIDATGEYGGFTTDAQPANPDDFFLKHQNTGAVGAEIGLLSGGRKVQPGKARPIEDADAEDDDDGKTKLAELGPQELLSVLQKGVKDLMDEEKLSESRLKARFEHDSKVATKRHAALIARQKQLNTTQRSLVAAQRKLNSTKRHAEDINSNLRQDLDGIGKFAEQLSNFAMAPEAEATRLLENLPKANNKLAMLTGRPPTFSVFTA